MTQDNVKALVMMVSFLNGKLMAHELLLAFLLKRMECVDPTGTNVKEVVEKLKQEHQEAQANAQLAKLFPSEVPPEMRALTEGFSGELGEAYRTGFGQVSKSLDTIFFSDS